MGQIFRLGRALALCLGAACTAAPTVATSVTSPLSAVVDIAPATAVAADGDAAAAITVRVIAADGAPAAGAAVAFAVSGRGNVLIPPQGTTGADGTLHARLTSTAAETKHVAVTVSRAGTTILPTGANQVIFVAGPASALAFTAPPGPATAGAAVDPAVTVAVVDAFGNTCATATPTVTLTLQDGTPLAGTFAAVAEAGQASFAAVRPTRPAAGAVLRAAADGLADVLSPAFAVAVGAGSGLNATPRTVRADGLSAATLTLALVDAQGAALAGVPVTWTLSNGAQLAAATPLTDATGAATATASAAQPQVANVSVAFAGGVQALALSFVAPPPPSAAASTVQVAPAVAPSDGSAQVAVQVRVAGADGVGLPNQPVSLTASGAGTAWSPAASGSTGPGGTFVAGLTATVAGTKALTAQLPGFVLPAVARFTTPPCAGAPDLVASATYPADSGSVALRALDLTGDGVPDLVAGNLFGGDVSVLSGRGDGTLDPTSNVATDSFVIGVGIADLDGDGRADLMATGQTANRVTVVLGGAGGSFAGAPTRVPTSAGPEDVIAVDVDRDGHLDLVVAAYGANAVDVLRGHGDGSFAAATTYPAGNSCLVVAAGDVNGDGWPDVIAAAYGDHAINVLLGHGDGTLEAAVSYPVPYAPRWVAAADLNGDGVPDLVATSTNEPNDDRGALSVMLGSGGGSFAAAQQTALSGTPFGAALGDFDANGTLDVAVAARSAHAVTLMPGHGDGQFGASHSYPAGANPAAVAAADFDGDGRLDVAVSNSDGPGGVTLLLNRGCLGS